ncbi:molybdopterin converting factor subunit 1 [Aestuariivirga sp.]|uniref:molybdopterin converting factor subunit 1 n=1 Tax=Aestuariivirga sp. TaxID=2650926 RepID=UPI0035945824
MKLVYFAWIRERIGHGEEEVTLPGDVTTIAGLLEWLKSRGEEYASALEHDSIVRVAINHEHVDDRNTPIGGAREIALFPPMTGG